MISAWSAEPSGWRKRHSMGRPTPGVRAASAMNARAPLDVVGVEEVGDRAPLHRLGLVAEHPRRGGTHEPDAAVGPDHDDDVGRVLHQRAEARLVLPHRRLGEQPHVLPDREELADHHAAR